jgi:hypothetical protein
MPFRVVYKPMARLEASAAYEWYRQAHIGMHDAFLADLERISGFLASDPHLYPRVEGEVRRANLNRFPYSLFFVIDADTESVLSCFHQHRDPKARDDLVPPQR